MAVPSSENEDFRRWTLGAVLLTIVIRMVWNGVASPPALPEEARYWVDGQSWAWGYRDAQPLNAWLVKISTDLLGTGLFGLRAFAPICHGLTAWLIFLTGCRLFGRDEEGPRVGFWAALSWLTVPAVAVSTGFMTSAPAMLTCWAMALYALARGMQDGQMLWWAICGGALGIGFMADPAIIAFPLCALGYALFSRASDSNQGAAGPLVAAGAALLAASPHLLWMISEGSIPSLVWGGMDFEFRNLALFVVAQLGVFGPILFCALIALALRGVALTRDWPIRLLLWLCIPLVLFVATEALFGKASIQDAGPAYIAGCLAVCACFVRRNFSKLLQVSLAVALGIWAGYWTIASLYDTRHALLPRGPDPFKKLRPFEPICKASMASVKATPDGAILADNSRLLSVCMLEGKIGFERAALWDPDQRRVHPDTALRPGDSRHFTYVTLQDNAEAVTAHFRDVERVAQVPFRSHRDRTYVASVWELHGFLGYPEN